MWLQWCMYIFFKGAISVASNSEATPDRGNKQVIIQNFAPINKLYFAIYKKILKIRRIISSKKLLF